MVRSYLESTWSTPNRFASAHGGAPVTARAARAARQLRERPGHGVPREGLWSKAVVGDQAVVGAATCGSDPFFCFFGGG